MLAELSSVHADGLEVSARDGIHAKAIALRSIFASLEKEDSPFNCWAISGHTASQPDDRLTNFRKLWKYLGVDTSKTAAADVVEWEVRLKGSLRFFGAIRVPVIEEALLGLLAKQATTWLVIAACEVGAATLQREIQGGWNFADGQVPAVLLQLLKKMDVVLVKDFGSQETSEFGAIAIGRTERIRQLSFSVQQLSCPNPAPPV